jgi:hypothetical protein
MEDEVLIVVSSGSKPENVSIITNFIIIFEHFKTVIMKVKH